MIAALRAVWQGIVQFERHSWQFIVANLLALGCAAFIITLPIGFAGLARMTSTAHRTPMISLREFRAGVADRWVWGLVIGVANVLIVFVLYSNFIAYQNMPDLMFVGLRIVWAIVGIVWISVQLYLWSILEEMDNPTLIGGLKNALIMTLANPFFTLTLLVVLTLILAFSLVVAVPLVILTFSVFACITSAAVIDRVERYRANSQQK
jgi:uncharacterized membrane protein YesL